MVRIFSQGSLLPLSQGIHLHKPVGKRAKGGKGLGSGLEFWGKRIAWRVSIVLDRGGEIHL